MQDAYGSYISDFFNSTILLSSIAVETLMHFILKLHGIQHCEEVSDNKIISYDVNTIDGIKKYGFYKNRFGEFIQCPDQKECFCELESLNKSIDECKNLNYDIGPLDQRVNKDNKHRLFVVRRDTVAHGNFEGLGLTQELVDIEQGKYKNQEKLIIKLHDLFNTHEPQAFEQYKSASEFIMNTFKKFDSEYGYK